MSADIVSLSHVKAYLQESKYPEGFKKDDKRRLREKSQSFKVKGDELYHTVKGKLGVETLVICDDVRKQQILTRMHSGIVRRCYYGQNAKIAKFLNDSGGLDYLQMYGLMYACVILVRRKE